MIFAADLFCGAGGTSSGLALAAHKRGIALDLVAVNHWSIAVATHAKNHPWARHICADLASVEADPSRLIPGGRLDILVASPECTHHSIARGGKPCSDQSRASAWHVLHWAERLCVEEILVENVKEFESWGPLTMRGRPSKRGKGATFRAWIAALSAMGFTVEWRVLNAADYGDATTRQRLFVRASRRGKITWPEKTHAGHWRAAREIIDWKLKGTSINGRKRPLAPRTLQRIEAGLRKFGGEAFLVVLAHTGADNSRVRDLGQPMPAIPAGHRGEHALCEPFVVQFQAGKDVRNTGRVRAVDEPLPTQPTENRFGLCEPFVIPMEHRGCNALRSVSEPLPTVTTAKGGAFGMCQPFLTKYYGTAGAVPVSKPLDTITSQDRFGLVQPTHNGMDILFRMLQPHELASAMGFEGYDFTGTKTDQVRQIGNAVCVHVAEALCGSILDKGAS